MPQFHEKMSGIAPQSLSTGTLISVFETCGLEQSVRQTHIHVRIKEAVKDMRHCTVQHLPFSALRSESG